MRGKVNLLSACEALIRRAVNAVIAVIVILAGSAPPAAAP